jgi:cytochrome c oxidase subunit 2
MNAFLWTIAGIVGISLFYIFLKILSDYILYRKNEVESKVNYNQLNAGLLLSFLVISLILFLGYNHLHEGPFLPDNASDHGVYVDRMFWITMGLTGVVFLLTQILLFYFAYKYAKGKNSKAYYWKNNLKIEAIWFSVPTVAFIYLFMTGNYYWNKITESVSKEVLEVEIMGEQFNWRVRYPGKDGILGDYNFHYIDGINSMGLDLRDTNGYDDFMPVQLHLPKNKKVLLRIRSRDVIHSVYIPNMRVKMDAVPGMLTRFSFTPKYTTEEMRMITKNPAFNYEIACAELCGRNHFSMLLYLVVEEEDEYQRWYNKQIPWLVRNSEYLVNVPASGREKARQLIDAFSGKIISNL